MSVTRTFFSAVVLLKLNQSLSVEELIWETIFVFTEMGFALFFELFGSNPSVQTVVDCVVKFVEAEKALVEELQTVCTWNSYCVPEVRPLTDNELLADEELVHVLEAVGLY